MGELKILSAGAVKPGLTKVIDAFQGESATRVQVSFATAPSIVERITAGERADVVIAPTGVLEELTKSGKCAPRETAAIGRIGVGVFVRDGEPLPPIATVESLKQSLLAAQSVVYNLASTGTYVESLFDRLGIAADLRTKATRYADFAAVLDHVSKGVGTEIGFGATTVIIESQSRGVKFAGPLPAEIQNYTSYCAAAIAEEDREEVARHFIHYLATGDAKTIFSAAGIL